MGWSCSALANHRLDAITDLCIAQTGMQNVFVDYKNHKRFFEVSRREYSDGAITGTIKREDGTTCGNLRIEGNGKITSGPKVLKDVPTFILDVDGSEILWRGNAPTDDTLHTYIKTEYMKQYYIGGVNAHVSKTLGYIPYPNNAHITDLNTGNVVATWKTAMFEAWE